jgi:hypothetical protein
MPSTLMPRAASSRAIRPVPIASSEAGPPPAGLEEGNRCLLVAASRQLVVLGRSGFVEAPDRLVAMHRDIRFRHAVGRNRIPDSRPGASARAIMGVPVLLPETVIENGRGGRWL